jgi:putative membrane protein
MDIDPRVRFSLERTLLSWIRTSIALMGFGFLVARFSPPFDGKASEENTDFALWIGVALILTGIFVNFAANMSFNKNIKRLQSGEYIEEGDWTLGKILSVFLSALSLLMVVYLIVNF